MGKAKNNIVLKLNFSYDDVRESISREIQEYYSVNANVDENLLSDNIIHKVLMSQFIDGCSMSNFENIDKNGDITDNQDEGILEEYIYQLEQKQVELSEANTHNIYIKWSDNVPKITRQMLSSKLIDVASKHNVYIGEI